MDKTNLDKELDKINKLSEKEVDEIFLKTLTLIIKEYKYGRLLLNKAKHIDRLF